MTPLEATRRIRAVLHSERVEPDAGTQESQVRPKGSGEMVGKRLIPVAAVVATAALANTAAQEGHPLVGSWHGDRGVSAKDRKDVTVIMDYDGAQITGVVNPGFENMRLQQARRFAEAERICREVLVGS